MKSSFFFCFLFLALSVHGQADTSQKIVEGRRNSPEQQKKPYVIMISADGFRYDYAEKHQAVHLQQLGRNGVKAEYMIPSYPSLTFPNHYTLVTGLYPSHHGLVDNRFFDRQSGEDYSMSKAARVRSGKWYGGTPLWVLAEQQQMLSASFYWVGTEAPIQETLPTYYYHYNEQIPIEKRIQVVIDWLQLPVDRRPHFISFYFPEVDHKGHSYGPDAPQTAEAVRWVDSAVHRLTEEVKKTGLDVNFIFVSDHGMTKIDTTKRLVVPSIDTSKAVVVSGGEIVQVYAKNKTHIAPLYNSLKAQANDYTVVLKRNMPSRLHYNDKEDLYGRIGDILILSDWPYIFASAGSKMKPGAHGFDPYKVTDMRAVFYAWGPAFKAGRNVQPIKNVDVFSVVTGILGLTQKEKIDGRRKLANRILNK